MRKAEGHKETLGGDAKFTMLVVGVILQVKTTRSYSVERVHLMVCELQLNQSGS